MNPDDWTWVLGIPVLVPFAGAAFTLLLARAPAAQRVVSLVALTIVLLDAVFIGFLSLRGPLILDVGGWAAPVGITLVADRLSALMLMVSVFVTLCVLVYSFTQDLAENQRLPIAVFQPTFLILSAGVSNAFLTGDLFNLYVGFEILLVASFVLITLGSTRERIRSGTVYVIVSVVSSTIFLIALAMVYAALGTVNMAQIAIRASEIDQGTAQLIQVMLFVAFGVKAAIFPLHAWLPDSYPTAPAPVTAVFAGLLTKVGIYAIIRTQTTLFSNSNLNGVLQVFGLVTMIVGIMGAVAQDDIKRLLSFTLVSHIGFMLWGVGIGTLEGLTAAIFYTAHHIIVQTALFLVSGLMERVGGSTSLVRLGSLLKTWPLLGVLFLIPAFNLAGIPPMSGFLGKLGLIEASAAVGRPLDWALVAGGLLTSLLTLYALLRAWSMAFWQPSEDDEVGKPQVPWTMTGATIALVAASLGLTLFAGPIYSYARGGAIELRAQAPYVVAVLPDAERGTGQSHTEAEEEQGTPDDIVDPSGAAVGDAQPVAHLVADPRRCAMIAGTGKALWDRSASPLSIVLLTTMWVLLWGDLSWGNVVAGFLLAALVTWLLPVPRGPRRRLTVRPIAFVRLAVLFIYDVFVAAFQIVRVILAGRTPREAIIRVQTLAHSDGFLAATAGLTALVPGSIVIDAHRLTGTLYVHVFDVGEGQQALDEAHERVIIQEERILRALATAEELKDAGYRPGGSMKAGRLTEAEMAAHRASVLAKRGIHEDGGPA